MRGCSLSVTFQTRPLPCASGLGEAARSMPDRSAADGIEGASEEQSVVQGQLQRAKGLAQQDK